MLEVRPRLLFDGEVLGMDVGRAAQRELDHSGADRLVGVTVDDDEGAGLAVDLVGVEDDRHRGREVAEADLVDGERTARRAARDESTSSLCLIADTVAGTQRLPIRMR